MFSGLRPLLRAQDHFFEGDTEAHAWDSLATLLRSGATDELVVDVGLPFTFGGVRYNVRAFLFRRRVLLLRPKLVLADDGNYREARWFTAWARPGQWETCRLPACVVAVDGQATAPLGDAALAFTDATLATELCEVRAWRQASSRVCAAVRAHCGCAQSVDAWRACVAARFHPLPAGAVRAGRATRAAGAVWRGDFLQRQRQPPPAAQAEHAR
jgi:hypothetical protein